MPQKGKTMLETRAAYGYYGEGHGATSETRKEKKTHASGWHFSDFYFEISGTYQQTFGFTYIEVKACDYAHAVKQAKRRAKREGFTLVGDKAGCEYQRNL